MVDLLPAYEQAVNICVLPFVFFASSLTSVDSLRAASAAFGPALDTKPPKLSPRKELTRKQNLLSVAGMLLLQLVIWLFIQYVFILLPPVVIDVIMATMMTIFCTPFIFYVLCDLSGLVQSSYTLSWIGVREIHLASPVRDLWSYLVLIPIPVLVVAYLYRLSPVLNIVPVLISFSVAYVVSHVPSVAGVLKLKAILVVPILIDVVVFAIVAFLALISCIFDSPSEKEEQEPPVLDIHDFQWTIVVTALGMSTAPVISGLLALVISALHRLDRHIQIDEDDEAFYADQRETEAFIANLEQPGKMEAEEDDKDLSEANEVANGMPVPLPSLGRSLLNYFHFVFSRDGTGGFSIRLFFPFSYATTASVAILVYLVLAQVVLRTAKVFARPDKTGDEAEDVNGDEIVTQWALFATAPFVIAPAVALLAWCRGQLRTVWEYEETWSERRPAKSRHERRTERERLESN